MKILGRIVAVGLLAAAPFALAAEKPSPKVAGDPRVVQALELARTWLEGQRAYMQIPGVSAEIVHDQEVLWSGGFGSADVDAKRAATADTLYSICSISKLFTSVAVIQQRDEGKLHLEDPVGKHLPWFRLKKTEGEGDVTVEGLLTHASGIPPRVGLPLLVVAGLQVPDARGDRRARRHPGGALRTGVAVSVLEPRHHARGRARRGEVRHGV